MKSSNFAVLACILICVFLAGGFVDMASATAPKVTVTPSDPAVKLGGSQQFKATVTGIKGATVTWTLDSTSLANGCTISSTGKLSVPATITPDSFKPVVTATYTGPPTVSGTATYTITDPIPAPGLFIGTFNCTGGSCNGEAFDLAMNVKKGGAIDVMVMNGTLTGYETFPGAIILKTNTVHGTFKNSSGTFTALGEVEYSGGTAEVLTGSLYTTGMVDPIGAWTATLTSTGAAKVGTFTITDKSRFGVVINGTLAGMAIPPSTNAFFGIVEIPKYNVIAPVNGSYDQSSNNITFNSTIRDYAVSGTGTMSANGDVSGDLVIEGKTVGTWELHNL
jgi:hypothetical protein